jgi:hypothetical protein
MEDIVSKGVRKICDSHVDCMKLPSLKRFVAGVEEEDEQASEASQL